MSNTIINPKVSTLDYTNYKPNVSFIEVASSLEITSVVLPNGLQKIGEYAFRNNLLTEITIPNSVTLIEDWAFSYNQINTINWPTTPLTVECDAFSYNPITDENGDIEHPSNVTYFHNCVQ